MKTNILRVLVVALVFSALMAHDGATVAKADDSASATASAQTPPPDIFFDLEPKPKRNELSFDTGESETDRYCVCMHKECFKYGETEYIKCICVWMSCVDLDMKPF